MLAPSSPATDAGLDVPGQRVAVSDELESLALRPLHQRVRYHATAYTDYTLQDGLAPDRPDVLRAIGALDVQAVGRAGSPNRPCAARSESGPYPPASRHRGIRGMAALKAGQ